MRRTHMLATALGAVLLTSPAFADCGYHSASTDRPIILAQGSGGGTGGGISAGTPGSPAAGSLGSTPQEMQGRSQQPAQGSATDLAPTQGRGAPDPSATPGAMPTAPGGTAVTPSEQPQTQQRR
ncbi:hypothetical protein [Roseicella aerolata]|uniref:Translation initiation factor IF-2 n=1 Tax=Roseicella aerolata TaxID=2883479 RepID=A0A9X1L864_9PROT|nr:hypothetical protein [Roseicella aerolata]MCB4822716.1 hypothetical protein [Roseicella aerolata]